MRVREARPAVVVGAVPLLRAILGKFMGGIVRVVLARWWRRSGMDPLRTFTCIE
jgi:hypothetical protein